MRITLVYLGHFLNPNGMSAASRRTRDIGRGLAANGHNVTIAVPRRSPDDTDTTVDGMSVVYLGGGKERWLTRRLQYWAALEDHVKRTHTDWVLLYYVRGDAVFAARRLKAIGCNVATIFSDKHSVNYGLKDLKRWPLWAFIKSGEAWLPKVSDLNICISRLLDADCKAYAPNVPSFILPVIVDSDHFDTSPNRALQAEQRWSIARTDITVGYLGGFWKHHGVRDLIDAFAQIAPKYPAARLFLAGKLVSAETHDDILALTAAHTLEDQVIVSDWMETEDVINAYSRLDILVLPQHDAAGIQAGMPTKVAEYAQMGKAIIATRTSDISDYFEDQTHALLVPPSDATVLAQALEKLIQDQSLRQTLGKNAAEMAAANFDSTAACRPLSDMLEAISRA